MVNRFIQTTIVAAIVALSSSPAKADLTTSDLRINCYADSVALYAQVVVPKRSHVDIVIDNVSSLCPTYQGIDQYLESSVRFLSGKFQGSDWMRVLKLKIEIFDLASGQNLSSLAQEQCYAGADIIASYVSNLNTSLRPVRIRITNNGSKDQLVYPEHHYVSRIQTYDMCR